MAVTVYELTDVQLLFAQTVENVFHYVDPAGSTDVAGLVANYVADVIPLWRNLQTTQLQHTAIRYRQVWPTASLTLEQAITPPVAGLESAEPLASCDAASIKWTLGNPTVNLPAGTYPHIKRGGMRVAGLTEGNVNGNSMAGSWDTDFHSMWVQLSNPGVGAFVLAVCSFLGPGSPGARARQHTVTQYTIVSNHSGAAPSTQNSRKVIRGRSF